MSSTKNIAKNSLFLYLRMFLNMGVSLFTAGVVLNTLGITDYGTYNIVGGFVSLFGFLNGSMSQATQRFLSYDLGKKDKIQIKKTFSTTVTIHFLIGLLIVLLLETIGLWYINNKLNLPKHRMYAVNIVFQFSVLTSFFSIIQVPYNALISAHEKFNVYAYISFLEILFKLIILYCLVIVQYDKLILYSSLLFISSFIIRMIYRIYCRKHLSESHYKYYFDSSYFKTMISFMGWNLFTNVAVVSKNQGVNLLLNAFYGTVINAAYGIAMQVQGIVLSFVSSFQNAVNPQIVKKYASGEISSSIKLMQQSAKFSFGLMLIIAFPILVSLENIFDIWLKHYPIQTLVFVKLTFINILIDTISNPLGFIVHASGKIKNYQIVLGILLFLNLPFSYLALKFLNVPYTVFIISICITFIALLCRIFFLKNLINLNISEFYKEVILPIIFLATIIIFIYIINSHLNIIITNKFSSIIFHSGSAFIIAIASCYITLLNQKEKQAIYKILEGKLKSLR
ncbi:Na+-driven multidrug efflux pump [Kaistella treverensis]|uniref:Na+-driven multidrug efflux pump n=1 Tax=Kaistella treverensis TaxID=631455 RepID=A0A1I3NJ99_9FLAO|nr:MATE family efflux transporter [Kaistella treverensis]SFJ09215.1 Na+-driven multidrug efflux pump [Kaistella treverensis]